MRARHIFMLCIGLAAGPAAARTWEVHPNPCPVPAVAPPFKPEADVRPANGGPDWSFLPPRDIYVEAPGFGRDFTRDYGPVYLRLNPDALSEPAQPSACEPEEAPQ